MIAKRGRSTLVVVHRSQLLDQWIGQLSTFLGVPMSAIGRLGAGKRSLNGHLDVAMFQSLVKREKVDDVVAGYGHVVVDECHHVSSVSFERVLRAVRARYVMGLTATPKRRDGRHPITEMQLGRIRFSRTDKRIAQTHRFSHRVITRHTGCALTTGTDLPADPTDSIQPIYRHLVTDVSRNNLIVSDVIRSVEAGRWPLVLTERRAHLDLLESRLRDHTANVVVLHGGLSKRERAAAMDRLRSFGDDEERLVLATGRFAGEGFDDPQLDTLFIALPVAWRGTLVQYAGRLHRKHHAKHDVQIFDYVDDSIPVLHRMFDKRRRGYRSMGYTIEDAVSPNERQPQLALQYRRNATAAPKTPPTVATHVEPPPSSELDAMIDDVLVDAFTPNDQAIAFLEMLDDQLELPFDATAGNATVRVHALAINNRNQLIAQCTTPTGRTRRIPLAKLVPQPPPLGWEWAEAHNRWANLDTQGTTIKTTTTIGG